MQRPYAPQAAQPAQRAAIRQASQTQKPTPQQPTPQQKVQQKPPKKEESNVFDRLTNQVQSYKSTEDSLKQLKNMR